MGVINESCYNLRGGSTDCSHSNQRLIHFYLNQKLDPGVLCRLRLYGSVKNTKVLNKYGKNMFIYIGTLIYSTTMVYSFTTTRQSGLWFPLPP